MSKTNKLLLIAVAMASSVFFAAPAMADWDPGDGHKMHFPQLPDPNGWDVSWSNKWLGDDWQCSQSGPVEDIHLWVSYYGYSDDVIPPAMMDAPFQVQIWSNQPADAQYQFSRPKDMLWEWTFSPNDYTVRYAGNGLQGWYWPASGSVEEDNHESYFQINIDNIPNPYRQTEGEVYWLVTHFDSMSPQIGWKTADLTKYPDDYPGHTYGDHFMDDAVFGTGIQMINWEEISIYGVSRDLAFVITPEPGTFVLLAMAGLGLLLFAWRRRK